MRMPRGKAGVVISPVYLLIAAALLTGCIHVRVVELRPGEPAISVALAVCTLQADGAAPTSTAAPTATPTSTGTLRPTGTTAPTQTATPSPTVTPSPTPCLPGVGFVEDVTYPDDAQVVTGEPFEKVWRLHSSGCAAWPAGVRWTFVSGERMAASDAVEVRAAAAGEIVDVAVPMVAPSAPGTYKGFWQMQTAAGTFFGDRAYVQITAVEPTPVPPPPPRKHDGGGSDAPRPQPTHPPPDA